MTIKSYLGSDTYRLVEKRKSRFGGLDIDLAFQRLSELEAASSLEEFGKLKSVGLHKLQGSMREFWSVNLNGPWRLWFRFQDGHAYEVHVMDPH